MDHQQTHHNHKESRSNTHQSAEAHQHHKTHKQKDHFNVALVVIFLAIFVSLISFMSENNKLTGFVVNANYKNADAATQTNVKEYNDVKSLGVLSPGNYYIDNQGYVYWMDDDSTPAVAKVKYLNDDQKNRKIYIDNEGNIGYLIN